MESIPIQLPTFIMYILVLVFFFLTVFTNFDNPEQPMCLTNITAINHRKYFLTDEILLHNKLDDIWFILNNRILNLTHLFQNAENRLEKILLQELYLYAGKDISHFFDANNKPLQQISISGKQYPLLAATLIRSKKENIVDNASTVTPLLPLLPSDTHNSTFWWNNERYVIGMVSRQTRTIRIINTLTYNENIFHVCDEDTIEIIQRKYNERFKCLQQSFVWLKKDNDNDFQYLDKTKTLDENGISFIGQQYGFYHTLWLYFISNFNTKMNQS